MVLYKKIKTYLFITHFVTICGVIKYYKNYILGNPTKFAPIPNPAPPRADAAILGMKTSKTENVAAAIKAMMTTSSMFNCFLGMT